MTTVVQVSPKDRMQTLLSQMRDPALVLTFASAMERWRMAHAVCVDFAEAMGIPKVPLTQGELREVENDFDSLRERVELLDRYAFSTVWNLLHFETSNALTPAFALWPQKDVTRHLDAHVGALWKQIRVPKTYRVCSSWGIHYPVRKTSLAPGERFGVVRKQTWPHQQFAFFLGTYLIPRVDAKEHPGLPIRAVKKKIKTVNTKHPKVAGRKRGRPVGSCTTASKIPRLLSTSSPSSLAVVPWQENPFLSWLETLSPLDPPSPPVVVQGPASSTSSSPEDPPTANTCKDLVLWRPPADLSSVSSIPPPATSVYRRRNRGGAPVNQRSQFVGNVPIAQTTPRNVVEPPTRTPPPATFATSSSSWLGPYHAPPTGPIFILDMQRRFAPMVRRLIVPHL